MYFVILFYIYIYIFFENKKYELNWIAISLQYLKKEASDEVDFLDTNKYESLLQNNTMILIGIFKHSQIPQNSKLAMPLQYIKKEVRDKLIFCMCVNIKISYKLISTL